MYLKQAVEYLKDPMMYRDFLVVAEAFEKTYLLCYVGTEKGYFTYGFQPVGRLAFYEFGIGTSWPQEDGLENYLEDCLKNGFKLYNAFSLKQVVQGNLTQITLEPPSHVIRIDGKDIKISHDSYLAVKKSLEEIFGWR